MVALVNMVNFSGWLCRHETVSINEKMIAEGYAWEYDGGTKNKNFKELRRFETWRERFVMQLDIRNVRTRWINVDKDEQKAEMVELFEAKSLPTIRDFQPLQVSSLMRVLSVARNTTVIVQSLTSKFWRRLFLKMVSQS